MKQRRKILLATLAAASLVVGMVGGSMYSFASTGGGGATADEYATPEQAIAAAAAQREAKAALASLPKAAAEMRGLEQAWQDCVAASGGKVTIASDGMTGVDVPPAAEKPCAERHAAIDTFTQSADYLDRQKATRVVVDIGWQCVANAGYIVEGYESHSADQPRSPEGTDPTYLDVADRCGISRAGQ